MRRFVDDPAPMDASDAILARIFRTVGPMPESEVARRRVLRAVQERGSGLAVRRAASAARARMAFAAGGLLVIGGVAGATVGRAAWDRIFPPATKSVAPVMPVPASPASSLARPDSAARSVEAAPALPAPALPGVAPAAPEASPVRAALPSKRVRARSDEAVVTLGDDNDTVLAQLATDEVRSGDPARARVLAEDYLARQPRGMVAEQMMYALAAAAAKGGDKDAAALAARYLASYPSGQFAALVRDLQRRLGSDGKEAP